MLDSQRQRRLPFRLGVNLFSDSDRRPQHCYSRDIGYDGLFAVGARHLKHDDPVRIVVEVGDGEGLHLDARVIRVEGDGVDCEFAGNSPATLEVLDALLSPKWDGQNLLEGVITFAPWYHDTNLASWMRLTSLVSDWRRLQSRAISSDW